MLVDLSARAVSDYLAIVEYICDYSRTNAEMFIDAFESALEDLRAYPRLGMVEAQNDGATRIMRFGAYHHLTYRLLPDRVFVLRVKDGRRRPEV